MVDRSIEEVHYQQSPRAWVPLVRQVRRVGPHGHGQTGSPQAPLSGLSGPAILIGSGSGSGSGSGPGTGSGSGAEGDGDDDIDADGVEDGGVGSGSGGDGPESGAEGTPQAHRRRHRQHQGTAPRSRYLPRLEQSIRQRASQLIEALPSSSIPVLNAYFTLFCSSFI